MTSIDEITTPDSIVLVDASIEGCGHNFGWDIYDSFHYDQIDTKILEFANTSLDSFLSILRNKQTRTIAQVSKEVCSLERIMAEKIKRCGHGFVTFGNHKRKDRVERLERNETLLKSAQEKCYQACRESRKNELIFGKGYDLLLEMTKNIETSIGLKIDTTYLLGEKEVEDTHSSDTDERLVAGLLYLSMFSDKKPILIGSDGDLVRLGGVVPTLIGAEDFMPLNAEFRRTLKENPFKIYYLEDDGNFDLRVDSSEIEYSPKFDIHNLPGEKSNKVREEIRGAWKNFIDIRG
jgi:hypothetical protein